MPIAGMAVIGREQRASPIEVLLRPRSPPSGLDRPRAVFRRWGIERRLNRLEGFLFALHQAIPFHTHRRRSSRALPDLRVRKCEFRIDLLRKLRSNQRYILASLEFLLANALDTR